MDEEKAAKTLTAVLAKNFGAELVQNKQYKDKLVQEAKYFYQFSDPFIIGFDKFYAKDADIDGKHYRWGFVGSDRTEKEDHLIYKTLKEVISQEGCGGANYFFTDEHTEEGKGINFFVTPYSIIGKKEAENLRMLFYKNVHPDIMSAMHTLGISDYTELYKLYSSNSMNEVFLGSYHAYLKLEDMLTKLDFERYDSNIRQSRIEALLGMSVEELNKKLDKNVQPVYLYEGYSKSEERYTVKNRIEHTKNEAKAYSMFGKWLYFLPDFTNFVFTLPLEDQNVETNKNILRLLAGNLDYVGILAKEYLKGNNFKGYFSCLDAKKQEKVVDALKALQDRNSENDAFLWSQGFKSIGMDYIRLYKEDASIFIDYFKNRSQEEKKIIMKDIMECEHVNENAINWLNENESELIREVGLNG